MRDIRFRAWDEDNKKMQECEITMDNYVHIWEQGGPYILGSVNEGRVVKQVPVMQYTGLKDMNAKDIYEGDIVTNDYDTGNVFWHDIYAQFQIDNSQTDKFVMPQDEWYLYEIIGNIYENKELLNDKIEKVGK